MPDRQNPYSPPAAPPIADAPNVRIVHSLEEAGPNTLVRIDGRGRPMSRTSYRVRMILLFGLGAGVWGLASYQFWSMAGWSGVLVAGIAVGLLAWEYWKRRRLMLATKLIGAERFDDAEELLRPLALRGRRRDRAIANALLATVALRRGEHAACVERARTAQALCRGLAGLGMGMYRRSWRYVEIRALATLGRCDEAEALRRKMPAEVPGSLLELSAWSTQLRIDFERGSTAVPVEELQRRAARLEKLAFEEASALVAWGLAKHGREAEARAMVAKALARPAAKRMQNADPKLWAWATQPAAAPR